jgi:hypothetical protein
LKATAVAPVRFVPVIVTDVPTWPEVGLKLLMVGPLLVTVKLPDEVALPLGVVTLTLPVMAPFGTVAAICVALFTMKEAAVPLNAIAVAPVRFVPVMLTDVPTCPLVGLKLEMVGADAEITVKVPAEVAVPGTVAVIRVALFTENDAALPLRVTPVVPFRFAPVRTTLVATGPLLGEKLLILGVFTWREEAEAPPPHEVKPDSNPIPVSVHESLISQPPQRIIWGKLCLFIFSARLDLAKFLLGNSHDGGSPGKAQEPLVRVLRD